MIIHVEYMLPCSATAMADAVFPQCAGTAQPDSLKNRLEVFVSKNL